MNVLLKNTGLTYQVFGAEILLLKQQPPKEAILSGFVRDAETGSYLAFDEHGVLYLYGRHAEIEKQLEDLGFENRKDALITEQGHWHIEIADTDSIRDRIICQLQLLER